MSTPTIRLEIDKAKVGDLARNEDMGRFMGQCADAIADSIRGADPMTTNLTGARAIHRGPDGQDHESAYGTVVNDDPGWHLIEYGTWALPGLFQMRAGVERCGARFRDRGPDA